MMSRLKAVYLSEQFFPSILGIFLNPFYFSRQGLFEEIKKIAPRLTGKTLDIGCGSKPYADLCGSQEYIGLEIDTNENRKLSQADFFYDGKTFPFPNATFDSVICNQVLEHVFTPVEFTREMNRVMKPGAKLLLTVPFAWDEHEQPHDYARYSSFGIRALLESNGLEIIEAHKTADDFRAIGQLWMAYLYKIFVTKSLYANAFFTLLFISPFTLMFAIIAHLLPKNSDFYLDNIILARKREE